ncbi:unnamed protein product [Coregonus sp. 'balchen']|nr:unnamed protein product [Coregonus sp. 'balchen']
MNYTRDLDEAYDEAWEEEMDDRRPIVTSNHMYILKEGVATSCMVMDGDVVLTDKWFALPSDSIPHVTLFVGFGYEARSLGPAVKAASCLRWNKTYCYNGGSTGEAAFIQLKQTLAQAEALSLPDYTTPFCLDVSEQDGYVHSILYQKQKGERRVLHYYSAKLDNIETGQTDCARHMAAIAKAVGKTAHIVMRHPLEINTDHGVTAFIGSKLFTLSSKRKSSITKAITARHITYATTATNMTDGMGLGEPHVCEDRAAKQIKV